MITREQAEHITAQLFGAPAGDPDNGWDLEEFSAGWLVREHATRDLRGAGFRVVERESGRVLLFPSYVPPGRILKEYDQVAAKGFPEDIRPATLPPAGRDDARDGARRHRQGHLPSRRNRRPHPPHRPARPHAPRPQAGD